MKELIVSLQNSIDMLESDGLKPTKIILNSKYKKEIEKELSKYFMESYIKSFNSFLGISLEFQNLQNEVIFIMES